MPDRITIFRRPSCAMCETEAELVEQVRITVVHEVGHHFGIDDDRLHELGLGLRLRFAPWPSPASCSTSARTSRSTCTPTGWYFAEAAAPRWSPPWSSGSAVLAGHRPAGGAEALAGILVLAASCWFGMTYARWATTNFVVTTDRLIYRHGVIAKKGIEIPLERINTVFFSQSIFERMLGPATSSSSPPARRAARTFSNMRKPSAVQNEIYRQMEANENRKYDRDRHRRSRAAAGPSIPEQIEQLDALRKQGVITEAEFQAKKADLLRRM